MLFRSRCIVVVIGRAAGTRAVCDQSRAPIPVIAEVNVEGRHNGVLHVRQLAFRVRVGEIRDDAARIGGTQHIAVQIPACRPIGIAVRKLRLGNIACRTIGRPRRLVIAVRKCDGAISAPYDIVILVELILICHPTFPQSHLSLYLSK